MRVTYTTRFENLLANSKLSGRDRKFLGDLQAYYLKNKSLTSGRAHWVRKLEERYAKLATGAMLGDAAIDTRLKALKKVVQPSSWSEGFVESLTNQNAMGKSLSEKQISALERIESENTGAAKQARDDWYTNYDDSHREQAKICAEYYVSNPPYYKDLAQKILEKKDFIPSEKQWKAITQNKYAQKVLQNIKTPARFSVNSIVQLRKTASLYKSYGRQVDRKEKIAFILQADVDSPSAIKGGRWYTVLFAGEASSIKILEKDLKPAKV